MIRPAFVAVGLAAASAAPAAEFSFVALGDMPYGDPAEVYAPFEALIDAINARDPRLVVHIGDTKSGGTPCSNEMLDDQLAYMNAVQAPVLYTPGDNEWTDCHREAAGGFDPLDRLAYIRETYFAEPGTSLGAETLGLAHQGAAGYPENARAMVEDVLFVTAHVVGSNNNFEIRDIAAVEEFMARDAANIDWIGRSFAEAGDAAAAVVAIHADMFEFDFDMFGEEGWLRHSGFHAFGPALQTAAAEFGRPVLLIFGDSHKFQVLKPFPEAAPNLTALEVFGADDMHAVEVTVDTSAPGVFGVAPIINPALSN